MAALARWGSNRLLLENVGCSLLRTLTQPAFCAHQAKRYLLTDDILKLEDFQQKKLAIKYHIHGKKDLYFEMIEGKLQSHGIILRDELKTLLHLCQTPADVEFAKQVIYRYHEENKNVMFGEFRFGPIFLRLCYELDLADAAFNLIKDQTLRGFFSDCTSFNILMDMLFTKGQYERALEVLVEMRNRGVKFVKETYILAFAICYKLNNSHSWKICTNLLEEIELKGDHLPRQAFCFAVALALKRNEFAVAKSIYSQIMNTDGKLCNNLHFLIKAHTGTMEDVLHTLETAADTTGQQFVKKLEFSEQGLAFVREKLKHDSGLHTRFHSVYTRLQNSGQISADTLDDMLCYTPHARTHNLHLLSQRKVSRRTFRPLQSALLME